MFKKSTSVFLFSILFIGCIQKANIKIPKAENKLVVTCFISPGDSIIGAAVKLSTPRFGSSLANGTSAAATFGNVEDAMVIIGDGTNSIVLPFSQDQLFYKAPANALPIVEGKTYYLTVRTPDGKFVDAKTTVPEKQLQIDFFETRVTKNDSSHIEADVDLVIADIPGHTNYLSIFYENVILPDSNLPFTAIAYFDTDEKIEKTKYHNFGDTFFYNASAIQFAQLNISVLNSSKEFYLYNKSVQEAGIASFNPFSDPVLVYTNVNNGFGCFGSYVGNYTNKRFR